MSSQRKNDPVAFRSAESETLLNTFFEQNENVEFVRFCAMDLSSVVRVIVVPKSSALDIAKAGFARAFGSPFTAGATSNDNLMFDHLRPGADKLIPDWGSLTVCKYYPVHAMVMCFCQEQGDDKSMNGHALDPRAILGKHCELSKEQGIDMLIGLEIEFLIHEPSMDFSKPLPKCSAMGATALHNKFTPIMDEIVMAIEKSGIKVMKYHPEDGILGFFEIVLAPYTPIQAADAMVYCHEAIKTISQKHGLLATMSPTPTERQMHIGSHTSISISNPDNGNSESFLAGLLTSMPAVCALAMPNYESSGRNDRCRTWIQWAVEYKGSVIRERGKGIWELRCPDGTMNPYLAFAAIIAAGMNGLRTKQELTMKPNPGKIDLDSKEVREELGITEKLPASLQDALDALKKDEVLSSDELGLGEQLVKFYSGIKAKEIETYGSMPMMERKAAIMRIF